MALGDPYVSKEKLKSRLDVDDELDELELVSALAAASRAVEALAGRQFNDSGSATARYYRPTTQWSVRVDDFHTAVGLEIATDESDSGTYGTVWSAADYELWPLNGIRDGQPGWPTSQIRAVHSRWFPCGQRATVRVTARWGWENVPEAVAEATLIAAVELFKLKDTPFGVGGYNDFGIIRVRNNPFVERLLSPYVRTPFLVA